MVWKFHKSVGFITNIYLGKSPEKVLRRGKQNLASDWPNRLFVTYKLTSSASGPYDLRKKGNVSCTLKPEARGGAPGCLAKLLARSVGSKVKTRCPQRKTLSAVFIRFCQCDNTSTYNSILANLVSGSHCLRVLFFWPQSIFLFLKVLHVSW